MSERRPEFGSGASRSVSLSFIASSLENFWSLLKRGLRGTYIAVDAFHLHRYVDEQVFRYNERRDASGDSGRFVKALRSIVGKRLTYRDLASDPGQHRSRHAKR